MKTTYGRVPTAGCWPLAPSLDTIGPMATSVTGVLLGMDLLEPGFAAAVTTVARPQAIGRLRLSAAHRGDPRIEAAIDAALAAAELTVIDVELPGWVAARDAALTILVAEAWRSNRHLLDRAERLTPAMAQRIRQGANVTAAQLDDAFAVQAEFRRALGELFTRVELLATPTLPTFAPLLDAAANTALTTYTRPANLAGTPALALPVPTVGSPLPASLQLMGGAGDEERLVALAAVIEEAVR